MSEFRTKINSALAENNILRSDLVHAMNRIGRVNQMTVYNFLNGKSTPGIDKIELMLQALESLGVVIKL